MSHARTKHNNAARPAWVRSAGAALAVAIAAAGLGALVADAAELVIDEGVVVKFGNNAGIVVRDNIQTARRTTFTSIKDDAAAGQTGSAPQTPAAGDWTGLKLEASVPAASLKLRDSTIRYSTTGLDLRKIAPTLYNLQITDSVTGVRISDGSAVKFDGLGLIGNGTGIEVSNSTPTIIKSQIQGSSVLGISNLTPTTAVTATGNWWGDASGPYDAAGNPAGLGNGVSAGVTYGSWLAEIPLVDPTIKVANGVTYTEQQSITLDLYCRNAVEYRIAEGGNFTGVTFQPMAASVPFTLSAGDGTKQISVQYRAATGNIVTAALANGILYDTQGPTLAITNPSEGSYVTNSISVSATATDTAGVAKVEFYIDNQLKATDTSSPYSYAWDAPAAGDGSHSVKAIAYDGVGRTATDTRAVIVAKAAPPPPDTSGPALTNLKLGGTLVAAGSTFTKSGSLTVSVSDPSGISRIEFWLDGVLLATDTNAADGYGMYVDLVTIPDGDHTLTLRAYDSLGNMSEASSAVVVALAPPATPTIATPKTGLTTNLGTVTVTGTAESYVQVAAYSNGAQVNGWVDVDAAGKYTIPVTLADGLNRLQTVAANRGGSSALTNEVQVTVDTSIPQTPLGLNAVAQTAGKIKLTWNKSLDSKVTGYNLYRSTVAFEAISEAVKVNTSVIAPSTTGFDDLPKTDGTYYYRVVAVNSLGTASVPSNQVSAASDNTLPKATEIVYTPTGKTDPATGRIAVGRVDVVVKLSEPLQAVPFLSIAPTNGVPLAVDLVKSTDTEYRGYFTIQPGMPSGVAYAVFSARDLVGNRGTDVTTGATLNIDAQGPLLTQLLVSPAAPIKNDATTPAALTVNLTLSEAIKPGVSPQLSYLLSSNLTSATPVTGLTQTGALTWSASFTLPASAGQSVVELLSFTYSGVDDLDNVATSITAANSFQVYQGELPPLAAPLDFAALAEPAGKVRLNWRMMDDAVAYQLYRQAPGEGSLTAFQRVNDPQTVEFIDATTADGLYRYAIASIRQANGQESVSAQSAIVEATADSLAPQAPTGLALALAGNGINATWTAPAGGAATYKLYRSSEATITDVTGLTPVKTGIKQTVALDASPSPTEHAYAVTAVDAAGNESAVSNSAYLNFTLLPVATLAVVQTDAELPVVSWTHKNAAAIAGYDVYLGPDSAKEKLNIAPITGLSYTDTGYASDARRYTVVAFDSNGVEIGRSLTLPKLSAELVSGTPLQRNMMNRLQYRVTNAGAEAVNNARVKAKVGTRETSSEPFSLAAGESRLVGVVVGGYADLPSPVSLVTTLEVAPNEGEKISIVRNGAVDAQDGSLVLALAPENLTRGGTGKATFTLENTSDVDIELLTATATGKNPSPDIRYKLLDKDGNVLATQSFKQALGTNVVTISTGQTVARIPARTAFTSDAVDLAVPSAASDDVNVQLEVDRIHYKLGAPETVSIGGLTSRKAVTLVDTAYYGEVTNITPVNSFGDQDVVISGRAISRAATQPLANAALRLVFVVNGFERKFDVVTDGSGNFSYTFKPTASDGGVYKVSCLHPDILERPVHGQFVINSVVVSPTAFKLTNPRNYPYTIKFRASAGEGTTATNVRVVYDAQSQPSGSLPAGVKVETGTPLTLGSKQSGDLTVTVTGDNSAAETGAVILKVLADEKGTEPVASIRLDYRFTEAKAALAPSPSYVETGLAQGSSVLEQVTIENRGFAEAQGVTVTLLNTDGTPAPAWVYLPGGGAVGNLAIGEKRVVDIAIDAPATMSDGIYTFKLRVAAANTTGGDVPVYVSLTQSGIGNALFKASDIYTGTVNQSGQRIAGLSGARITVQNEAVTTVTQTVTTDSLGEAYFTDLPAGRYKFRATALNHQEIIGRLTIKPGITVTEDVFLDYNLVTVEWSVTEITIQDKYEITLTAIFETNVPAPVVVMEPVGINLPVMKAGDIFYGELTLTNYGLVRADDVVFRAPRTDDVYRFEFMANVPSTLEAKQRVTIPYRVVVLKSLDDPAPTATGGGCYTYANSAGVGFDYECANGTKSSGSASSTFIHSYGTCSSGSSGGGGGSGGSGGGGGGGWGGGGGGAPVGLPGAACVPTPECNKCCKGNGSAGGE